MIPSPPDANGVLGRGAFAGYAIVPDLILTSTLSPTAKLVAAALCRSALPPAQWTSAANGALAERCGINPSNVSRALNELERAGFVVRVTGTDGLERATRLGWSCAWSIGSPRRAIVLVWRLPGCPIQPRPDLPAEPESDEQEYRSNTTTTTRHHYQVDAAERHIDAATASNQGGSRARSSIVVLENKNYNVDARGGQRPTQPEEEAPPTDEDIAQAKVWASGTGPLATLGRLILERVGLPVPSNNQRPSTKPFNDPDGTGTGTNGPPKTGPLPPKCPPGCHPAPFAGAMGKAFEVARLMAIGDGTVPTQQAGLRCSPTRPAVNVPPDPPQRPMAQSTVRGRPQESRETKGLLADLPGRPEMVPTVVARIVREFEDHHSERFWTYRLEDLAAGRLAMAPVLDGYTAASRYKDRAVGRRVFAASVRRGAT